MSEEDQGEVLQPLTLSELRQRLEDRGIKMALSTFSEFVQSGDISEQLQVGGTSGRREFLPDTLKILTAFFPEYKKAKGRLPQASEMLRSFLKGRKNSETSLVPGSSSFSEPPKPDALQIARAQGHAQQDKVFTASEAAEFLRVTVPMLRKYGPKPFKRFGKSPKADRWRLTDLLSAG